MHTINFDLRAFPRFLRFFAVISVLLAISGRPPFMSSASADPPVFVPQAPVTNRELVRNGNFSHDQTAWALSGSGSYVKPDGGSDGSPALVMDNITGDPADFRAIAVQELYLPTQTTAATFTFDFGMLKTYGTAAWFEAGLIRGESLAATTVITIVVSTGWMYDSIPWQHVSGAFSAQDVIAIQSAHAAGEHVWLVFNMHQPASNQFQTYVDNVSVQASGDQTYPTGDSAIAFVGVNADGYDKTVNQIHPDGTHRQTLWTHPSAVASTNHIYDVAWNPAASELAFSSNHEMGYSAFNSDVYGIRTCGSAMRRITNPPSKAELDAGGYAFGSVTGKVQNNYGSVTTFHVYIEGATELVPVEVGGLGSEVSFSVPNVADLGTGLHAVTFIWSKGTDCANGREYAAAVVDVAAGGSVDAGTLTFNGTCGTYNSNAITWKGDGSVLGVDVIAPRAFLATGQSIGSDLFSAPLTADSPVWSPVNDSILYRNWIISGDSGIYLTSQGGDAGTWLVNDGGALWVTPAWLPDGSGFVYTIDRQLRQYIIASSQDTLLAEFYNEYVGNPSVSPDGNYVVFQRQTTGSAPIQYDLWVVRRQMPTEMWPLSTDGRSYNPDWSRTDVSSCSSIYLPLVIR
ncbi:MAG: hypothetical protein JXA21_23960 [Anaerolineae bacterium]|nr:hypothetical protein [Anaerolineae bacterium]